MILAKSDPLLARTGRPPRADGRFFFALAAIGVVPQGRWKEFADDFAPFR
jgi:hypothetical protein